MSDDFSFEELMAQQGVQKLGGGNKRAGPRQPPPPPRMQQSTVAVRPNIVPRRELDAAEQQLEAATSEARALSSRVCELEAALAAATKRGSELEATLESERGARAEETAAHAVVAEEEAAFKASLERQLKDARGALSATEAAKTSLADALIERGCATEFEMMAVLNGLLLQRPREFLDSIVLADPHALAKVLSERVAFVASEVPFEPDKNMVVVPVNKERCEICSGSDIAASFHGFVQACVDNDVRRATIVGGSPAYRRQLQALADEDEDAPKLNLVSGTRQREKRRAASDLRSSDVVVIWGGTELDHSVSEVYRGEDARIVRVAHRGIARMLQIVRSELRR